MPEPAWISLAALGLTVTGITAVGTRIMRDIPWHELEELCRRKRRHDVFEAIHDQHDRVHGSNESLHLISTCVTLFLFVGLWLDRGNTLSNVMTAQTLLVIAGLLISLLALSIWIPWALAKYWPAPLLYYAWNMWAVIAWLANPLWIGATFFDAVLVRLAGHKEQTTEEEAFEEEIRAIVTDGLHDGVLEADTREMIEGVIELGDVDVADIMTPRSSIDAVQVHASWSELMQAVIRYGRTRVPVYDGTLDNIVGTLYVKDLLPEFTKPDNERRPLRELLRQSWSVPETRRVDDLLQDFRKTRNHLAIVVDEYRAVTGLVTIEDALEEIVGEIVDESDKEQVGEIHPIDASTADVVARAHLSEINETLGTDLGEEEDFDTIGGLVVNKLGRIPTAGESVRIGDVRITVTEASRRKVEKVRIDLPTQAVRS